VEAVSVMISESAATQFSLTISESIGLWALTNPHVTFGIGFVDDFRDDCGLIFINNF
jgi:hypothetical protein